MRPMPPLTADERTAIRAQAREALKRTTAEQGLDVSVRDPELLAALATVVVSARRKRLDAEVATASIGT